MSLAVHVRVPCERQVGEEAKPFTAFCHFRDQPPGTRSMVATDRALGKCPAGLPLVG